MPRTVPQASTRAGRLACCGSVCWLSTSACVGRRRPSAHRRDGDRHTNAVDRVAAHAGCSPPFEVDAKVDAVVFDHCVGAHGPIPASRSSDTPTGALQSRAPSGDPDAHLRRRCRRPGSPTPGLPASAACRSGSAPSTLPARSWCSAGRRRADYGLQAGLEVRGARRGAKRRHPVRRSGAAAMPA